MTLRRDLIEKSDKELLLIVLSSPDSADAGAAREIMGFRRHGATSRQTFWMVVLTIVLALSSLLEVSLETWRVRLASRAQASKDARTGESALSPSPAAEAAVPTSDG